MEGAAVRRSQLDLDVPVLEHARELVVGALAGGGRLPRDELFAVWDESGVATAVRRGPHMLGYLAQTGGPAMVKDLMRWGHLVVADARAGLALARGRGHHTGVRR